jgi:hypothetical protein
MLAAIDFERHTGHKCVGHREKRGIGHLRGCPYPLRQVGAADVLEVVALAPLAQRIPRAGVNDTRRDRVDPDRGQLDCQRTRQKVDRAVGDRYPEKTDVDFERGKSREKYERPALFDLCREVFRQHQWPDHLGIKRFQQTRTLQRMKSSPCARRNRRHDMVNKPYSPRKGRNRRIIGHVHSLGIDTWVLVSGCQSGLIAAGDNDSSALRTSYNRDSTRNPTPLPHDNNGLTPQRLAHSPNPFLLRRINSFVLCR